MIGLGALVLLVRFAVRCISLRRMRQRAELLEDGRIKIYRVRDRISPFSFGNAIYINTSQHSEKEKEEIILHEYVHIRQRHTADILFAEFVTIFNWYNPFAWLIRYSIRQNLEFIADRQVVANGFDKKDYQYHLLKVVGQAQYRLANNFNFSSLKKRIAMMNRMRSARVNLLKFLFILPLLAVLLVAFRDRYSGLWKRHAGAAVVNIAGIVFDLDGRAPLDGVTVRDRSTGLRAVSDDRGFYQFSIPIAGDSMRIDLDFTKVGYDPTHSGDFFYPKHTSVGQVWATPMWTSKHISTTAYMSLPYMGKLPVEPGYDDAVKAWKEQLKWNDDFARFRTMQAAHPEVSLFYTTEGKQRQIVILKNGTVEKYGYPDGPSVADMEKKYGTLPDYAKGGGPTAGGGYLARWAAIAAQAEKEFHASGGNPLAIVFPGDSRVIAVDREGKARIYDMDNDDPKERPAFEKAYGKLPDCVPAGYHYNYQGPSGALPAAASPSGGKTDTTAPKRDSTKPTVLMRPAPKDSIDEKKALWLLDGVEKKGWTNDSLLIRKDIASVEILGPAQARVLFGDKGARGAIAIVTKENDSVSQVSPARDTGHFRLNNGTLILPSTIVHLHNPNAKPPLYIIDGVQAPDNSLSALNPDDIASIQVLRDQAAMAIYGEKAKDGVILITTKTKVRPQVVVNGIYNGEKVTGRADTIVTAEGRFHAVNPSAKP